MTAQGQDHAALRAKYRGAWLDAAAELQSSLEATDLGKDRCSKPAQAAESESPRTLQRVRVPGVARRHGVDMRLPRLNYGNAVGTAMQYLFCNI